MVMVFVFEVVDGLMVGWMVGCIFGVNSLRW